MIHFKSCPRCKGDMYDGRDVYGEYRECLQCGFILDAEKSGVSSGSLVLVPSNTTARESPRNTIGRELTDMHSSISPGGYRYQDCQSEDTSTAV